MTLRPSGADFAALIGACWLCLAGCGAAHGTQRVFSGRSVEGPYIEPQAYAAYARGSYLEARGDWAGAEQAYRRALSRDPDSPGIWTRLGVLACKRDLKSALEYFQTDGVGQGYAPAWAERGRCLREQGDPRGALDSARRAVTLDPSNVEANLLVADSYAEQDQPARSSAWLFAWLLRDAAASSHWRELYERGERLGDPGLQRLALAQVNRWGGVDATGMRTANRIPSPASPARHGTEAALRAGDLPSARLEASKEQIAPLELALLATANGQPALGLAQAQLILAADPDDGDAYVAALAASALLGDTATLAALLAEDHVRRAPSPDLAERMSELLKWYVGDAAAGQWSLAFRRARPTAP